MPRSTVCRRESRSASLGSSSGQPHTSSTFRSVKGASILSKPTPLTKSCRRSRTRLLCRRSLVGTRWFSVYLRDTKTRLLAGADLLSIAEKYRLDFALPYSFCATALACAGLRQWRRAEENIDRALAMCRSTRDMHAELLSASLLIRLHLHQGHAAEALRVPAPGGRRAIEASVAEYMCSRALALACMGRTAEALSEVDSSPHSSAVEPVVLAALVRAVCAFRSGEVRCDGSTIGGECCCVRSGSR